MRYTLTHGMTAPQRHPVFPVDLATPATLFSHVVVDEDPVKAIDRAIAILVLERKNITDGRDGEEKVIAGVCKCPVGACVHQDPVTDDLDQDDGLPDYPHTYPEAERPKTPIPPRRIRDNPQA